MDSRKHGIGNNLDNEDMKIAIRTECSSDNRITERSENDLKFLCTSDIDNDCSKPGRSTEESVSSERTAGMLSRCNDFDLPSTEENKYHISSFENKREIVRKLKNNDTVTDLAMPCNTAIPTISDIRVNKDSIISFVSNQEPKSNNTCFHNTDFNVGCNEDSKTSRQQSNRLLIKTKTENIQRLTNQESAAPPSCIYKVAESTISDIQKQENSILTLASELKNDELKKRKKIQRSKYPLVDDAVYMWYLEELYNGKIVTREALRVKALDLNNHFGYHSFKASIRWVCYFESRHGIKLASSNSKISIGDTYFAVPFMQSYLDLLQREGYSPDDVYSAVESTIEWRPMPKYSIKSNRLNEKNIQEAERVTVLLCANASWCHSLPLLVIGKTEEAKCFKGFVCFPLIYRSQRYGSMDSEILNKWYATQFIPAVEAKRGLAGKSGKVVLLLDALFDSARGIIHSSDVNFNIRILPPELTPMDQIHITKLKLIFKKNIIRHFLSPPENKGKTTEYSRKLNFGESCFMLQNAWNILREENEKEARKKQIVVSEEQDEAVVKPENDMEEFLELFKRIPEFSRYSKENALEWLLKDSIVPGHHENETVALLKSEEFSEDYDTGDNDTDDTKSPTNAQVSADFEAVLEWCKEQK